MRVLSLLVPLLVVGPFFALGVVSASGPGPTCVGVPCVGFGAPTYAGADAQCSLVVGAQLTGATCWVDGGHASVSDRLCPACIGSGSFECGIGTAYDTCLDLLG